MAVTEEKEEGEVDGEEGHELGVGRWHSIPLAEHFCKLHVSVWEGTHETIEISTTYPSVALP